MATGELILRMGDPRLRRRASEVEESEFGSAELTALVERLSGIMRDSHGIGIAAPQIGVGKRVLLMEVDDNPRYPDAPRLAWRCLINPEVTITDGREEEGFEGCLSVPGLRGPVRRAVGLQVRFREPSGARGALELTGLFARIVLHELDHLDGVLFLDRVAAEDRERIGFREELEAAGLSSGVVGATPAVLRELDAGRRSTAGE